MTSKDRKDMLGFIAQNIEAKVDEEYTQPIFDDLDRLLTLVSDERQEEAELLVGEIRDRVTAVSTATLRYVLQHAAIRVEWEVRPEQDEAATAGEEQGNNITLKQDEAAPHQDTLTVGPSIQELAERYRVAAGRDGRGPKLEPVMNLATDGGLKPSTERTQTSRILVSCGLDAGS